MGTGLTRRSLLTAGAAGLGGLAVGAAGATAVAATHGGDATSAAAPEVFGSGTVAFHGPHQAGVMTPAQAHAAFVAYDLAAQTDRAALGRMMRLLSDDAARLTAGRPALADTEPGLATMPGNLTVTFGFGPGLVARAGSAVPASLRGLPAFGVDRLVPRWSGGDLLVQVCGDEPTSLAHAERMLHKDVRAFATHRWTQRGFLHARGAAAPGTTPRNLMGQVDGTVNPDDSQAASIVWVGQDAQPGWLRGGTYAVLRRIRMDLDVWESLDPAAMEQVIGRRLADGAPLTGTAEHDEPDLAATDAAGLPVIPDFAHVRRARGDATGPQLKRRGYNYVETPDDVGLVFVAYQADVDRQFVPMQRRLDQLDLLNRWTIPIGSAVFAVPPGAPAGGWVGQGLLA